MMWLCLGIFFVSTCSRFCFGEHTTNAREYEFYNRSSRMPYRHDVCGSNGRILSFNDIQRLKENIPLTGQTWVDASGKYTPWMDYEGMFKIPTPKIVGNKTFTRNENEFTTCIRFCKSERYIGLQENTCFCLNGKEGATNSSDMPKQCDHSRDKYAQCARANTTNVMTVYSIDTTPRGEDALGECLTVTTNKTHVISYMPIDCNSTATEDVECFDGKKSIFRFSGKQKNFVDAFGYCESNPHEDLHLPGLKELSSSPLPDRKFWLSDRRKPYFLATVNTSDHQTPSPYCVSAQKVGGQIQLQLTDCRKKLSVVCLRTVDRAGTADTGESHTNDEASSDTTNSITMESTALLPNDDDNLPLIILMSIGSLAAVVIIAVIIVVVKKRSRQPLSTDEPTPSAVYATVDKPQQARPSRSDLGRSAQHNKNNIEENNDPMQENTYDHTNFTLKQFTQKPDVSDYDTVDSVQIAGESIYSRSESFRTTEEKMRFVEDSIYNQAFVVEAQKQPIDDREATTADRSGYQ